MNTDTWGRIRAELRETLGQAAYRNWIEPIGLLENSGDQVVLGVPTAFFGSWVTRNYHDTILTRLQANGITVERLEFRVHGPAAAAPEGAAAGDGPPASGTASGPARPAAAAAQAGEGDLPGATLDRRFTFESFVVGKPNELAHAAARRVAEGGPVTFNPLFLYGGVGLGKT
ncbi:MAG: chromosomal replication initiator protein DnaA, partial [Rhodobacteraceae bacterium]|nr:chromosomal replication initiator protein DnaA [Paracoccaceae bacterium]